MREEDLGGGRGEMLGGEPAVVRDDDALALLASFDDVASDAVGTAAHVLEGEVVGDPSAPAIRAEDDRRGRRCLHDRRHAHAPWRATRSSRARTLSARLRAPERCAHTPSAATTPFDPAAIDVAESTTRRPSVVRITRTP